MQVQKLSEEIFKVPGKRSDYRMSYDDVIMPMDAPNSDQQSKKGPSRYSIGLHLKSAKLHLTLNVNVKCETESGCTALDGNGKLLTSKDGIEISLEYKSSIPAKSCATKRMMELLDWIVWPFRSLKNKMVGAYNFLADKTTMGLQWIARQFQSLKNKIWSSIYVYLKPIIDNPIIVIEAVLEVIWFFAKPVWRAAKWLCEFMVAVDRQAKVTTAVVLEKYPIVLDFIETFQIMGGYVSSMIALWPWDWKDSIEYIGFSWVITYFFYHLLRFAAMDDREMQRIAREKDRQAKLK